jgi:hypothetical protein
MRAGSCNDQWATAVDTYSQIWCSPDRSRAIRRLSPLAGFALTLGLFAFYLWLNGLTDYWKQTAIELPKLYTSIFLNDGPITAIWSLPKYLFPFSLSEHSRQTILALIILSALGYWVRALVRWRKDPGDANLLFIALTTEVVERFRWVNDEKRVTVSRTNAAAGELIILDGQVRRKHQPRGSSKKKAVRDEIWPKAVRARAVVRILASCGRQENQLLPALACHCLKILII